MLLVFCFPLSREDNPVHIVMPEEVVFEFTPLGDLVQKICQGVRLIKSAAQFILHRGGAAVGENVVRQGQPALSRLALADWYSSSLGSSSFHQDRWFTRYIAPMACSPHYFLTALSISTSVYRNLMRMVSASTTVILSTYLRVIESSYSANSDFCCFSHSASSRSLAS